MKFLLEILGMTNYCNLRCSYCDWDFEPNYPRPLSPADLSALQRNLRGVRAMMEEHFPEVAMVEYSGGEPFLYPEAVREIITTFPDKWIRLITNGLLVEDSNLDEIASHGKAYIALSLDGPNDEANFARFHGRSQMLRTVLSTLDSIVEREIPAMVLCTLNRRNMAHFPAFVIFLEERYGAAIDAGRLVMPAHSVSEFENPKGRPEKGSCQELMDFVEEQGDDHPLIGRIIEHYRHLTFFMHNYQRKMTCNVFKWVVSAHFRYNEILSSGRFLSFGCGMRGEYELGMFDINAAESVSDFVRSVTSPGLEQLLTSPETMTYQCREGCFIDWVIFDMILGSVVSLDRAADWFVVFRDPMVRSFVHRYREAAT